MDKPINSIIKYVFTSHYFFILVQILRPLDTYTKETVMISYCQKKLHDKQIFNVDSDIKFFYANLLVM